jgi:hypothetical protein
MNFLEAYF